MRLYYEVVCTSRLIKLCRTQKKELRIPHIAKKNEVLKQKPALLSPSEGSRGSF